MPVNDNKRNGHPWSDEELRIAVDGYLYMLSLEVADVPFSTKELARFLTDGPLSQRNDASLRYRMRNVSFVLSERGLPTLKAYTPASQVGALVRERIEKILDESPEMLSRVIKEHRLNSLSLDDIMLKLEQLEQCLRSPQDKTPFSIGHNNPPEPMIVPSLEIETARISINNIKEEISSVFTNKKAIQKEQNVLLSFGLKLATMTEAGLSTFLKAAIGAAGATISIKLLVPHILETLEALTSFVKTLG